MWNMDYLTPRRDSHNCRAKSVPMAARSRRFLAARRGAAILLGAFIHDVRSEEGKGVADKLYVHFADGVKVCL